MRRRSPPRSPLIVLSVESAVNSSAARNCPRDGRSVPSMTSAAVASIGAGAPIRLKLRDAGLFPHALPLGDFAHDILRQLLGRRCPGLRTDVGNLFAHGGPAERFRDRLVELVH